MTVQAHGVCLVWDLQHIYHLESQNQPGQKRLLRSSCPTYDLTPACQPDHGTNSAFPQSPPGAVTPPPPSLCLIQGKKGFVEDCFFENSNFLSIFLCCFKNFKQLPGNNLYQQGEIYYEK